MALDRNKYLGGDALRFTVYLGTEPLGSSDLEGTSAFGRRAVGRFAPAPAYARVHPLFAALSQLQADGPALDDPAVQGLLAQVGALGLELRDAAGIRVAAGPIQVHDFAADFGGDRGLANAHGYALSVEPPDLAAFRARYPEPDDEGPPAI